MRTLITETLPHYEGIDTTKEYELADNIGWDINFFCNKCGIDVVINDVGDHICRLCPECEQLLTDTGNCSQECGWEAVLK